MPRAPPSDTAASFVLGALSVEQDSLSQYRREHRYDTLARRTKTHTRIGGEWFTECATYDRYGRAKQSFDASGEGVANEYSPEGYVLRIREAGTITAPSTTGPILWERFDSDARGNVTRERLAGVASMETTRSYNVATGRLSTVYTSGPHAASGFPLQDLVYTHDFHGNVLTRADKSLVGEFPVTRQDVAERFTYDPLDRLTAVTRTRFGSVVSGGATQVTVRDDATLTQTYDRLGNLMSRTSVFGASNLGAYTYKSTPAGCTLAGPHAVSGVGAWEFCYDANGNQTLQRQGMGELVEFAWTGFDLPQRVRRRSTAAGYDNTSEFFYAPDRSRYKRVDRVLTLGSTSNIFRSGFEFAESDPAGVPRTYRFVGNVEFAVENGVEVVRRSIGGFLVHRRTAGGGASYEWRLSDGLGSVDAL
ncbi:MAG: hypothetical protein ACK55W_05830, partial [Pseudomonadota bacterium]